jgi:hypothetical protein
MIMMSALYSTKILNWIFIVLLHWDKSLWVGMSFHSDTLSEFWASKSLRFLLNVVCLPVASTPIFTPPMRCLNSGADPGFQVRGGGALKKIAPVPLWYFSTFLSCGLWMLNATIEYIAPKAKGMNRTRPN